MSDGEIGAQEVQVPLTEQENLRLVQQRFSSTERQVCSLSHPLRWRHDQAPGLLLNCRLQYQTDRANFCIVGMKGANKCLETVAEVYCLCVVTDIHSVWRPCTDDWQRHADTLSKYEDNLQ